MRYYYLLSGLQDLTRNGSAMPREELLEQMQAQMPASDLALVELLAPDRIEDALSCKNRFVRDWARFNKDLNNILVNEICRKHGFKAEEHLHGELPEEIAPEYLALGKIENLYEREKAQDAIRWEWLEERTLFDYFELENVLAYYLQCEILHRWDNLTKEDGERVFKSIIAEMKQGIKF